MYTVNFLPLLLIPERQSRSDSDTGHEMINSVAMTSLDIFADIWARELWQDNAVPYCYQGTAEGSQQDGLGH